MLGNRLNTIGAEVGAATCGVDTFGAAIAGTAEVTAIDVIGSGRAGASNAFVATGTLVDAPATPTSPAAGAAAATIECGKSALADCAGDEVAPETTGLGVSSFGLFMMTSQSQNLPVT